MAPSAARRRSGRKKKETTMTEIPDHLLAEIFLRLPAAEDLARASAACVTFRRLVFDTDGSFLRRFRRPPRPAPPRLFRPRRVPPRPPASPLRARRSRAHRRRRLLLLLLPQPPPVGTVADIRDGRVLLRPAKGKQPHVSNELAVCDPLQRRSAPDYAYGCFYWESTMMGKKELLVLDTRTMDFSISDLQPREWCTLGLAIVEARDGRLGLFGILDETLAAKYDLYYYTRGNEGEGSSQSQLEKTISLGSGCQHHIKTASGRYLLLGKFGAMRFLGSIPQSQDLEYISVHVKTLQLERVYSKSFGYAMSKTWIYTNFPPSLSSLTI